MSRGTAAVHRCTPCSDYPKLVLPPAITTLPASIAATCRKDIKARYSLYFVCLSFIVVVVVVWFLLLLLFWGIEFLFHLVVVFYSFFVCCFVWILSIMQEPTERKDYMYQVTMQLFNFGPFVVWNSVPIQNLC